MRKKIFITGAYGYLGGRIARYLSDNPALEIILGVSNNANLVSKTLFSLETRCIDLLNPESLVSACHGVDTVIHLAAVNEIISLKKPELALKVNTEGTLHLLNACVLNSVKRIIYFSTAHVYGAPLVGKLDESKKTRPIHPYAYTHRASEDILWSFTAQKKIEGIAFRLSNAIGSPLAPDVSRWTLLVNDLCRQAVTTKKLKLNSSGSSFRNFVSVSEVARVVAFFIDLPASKIGDGLYNLGSPGSLSVMAMAKLIQERCFKLFRFEPAIETPAGSSLNETEEVDKLHFEIKKIQGLGLAIESDFSEAIDETLIFCHKHFYEE